LSLSVLGGDAGGALDLSAVLPRDGADAADAEGSAPAGGADQAVVPARSARGGSSGPGTSRGSARRAPQTASPLHRPVDLSGVTAKVQTSLPEQLRRPKSARQPRASPPVEVTRAREDGWK
jgi:hypothetical protein